MNIGSKKQLLVDDFIIEEKNRWVRRVINQPQRHSSEPIMVGEKAWENWIIVLFGTVLYDEEEKVYKMWYTSGLPKYPVRPFQVCYAISKDGITWQKPKLGIVDYHGSSENNIILPGKVRGLAMFVMKDLKDPDPARRYKALYWDGDLTEVNPELAALLAAGKPMSPKQHAKCYSLATAADKMGICFAFSPDGIHWQSLPEIPQIPVWANNNIGDTNTLLGWDPRIEKYVGYFRIGSTVSRPALTAYRLIGRSVSDDFINWSSAELVLATDELDPPGTELYSMSVFIYEDLYLGLLQIYHDDDRQTLEYQLASSRDGIHWNRVANREIFFPIGPPGSWDRGMIVMPTPVVLEDEIRFYYEGSNLTHYEPDLPKLFGKMVEGERMGGAVGLATLRPDGFVSMDSGPYEGTLSTKLIRFKGKNLILNADAQCKGKPGSIKVGILNYWDGKPIVGYTQKDADPVIGNGIKQVVTWNGKSDIEPLAGCPIRPGYPIRLKFYLQNSKLYSFQFV